jgi:hypothetical protein
MLPLNTADSTLWMHSFLTLFTMWTGTGFPAKKLARTDLEPEVDCPICFERFETHGERLPKALPCDHVLCRGCVRALTRSNCPECFAPLPVPVDAGRLPNAVPVMRMLESLVDAPKTKGGQTCSLPGHHGQILEAFCTVCKESICQRCALWGHRAHELVPLDGVQDSVLSSEASNVQELVKQCFKYENEAQVNCRRHQYLSRHRTLTPLLCLRISLIPVSLSSPASSPSACSPCDPR